MAMGHYAGWIVLGLVAGALARWILPGQEKGGWVSALVLGIIGAIVGGWIARKFGYLPPADPGDWIPGLRSIGSATVGAIIVLSIWKWFRT
jgi:uncharacterized membrane protein YeaQ/YmgE (transglycosylase-associated protein family)